MAATTAKNLQPASALGGPPQLWWHACRVRDDFNPLQPTRLPLQSVVIKDRPRRLDRIFAHAPIFFVTFCTRDRRTIYELSRVEAAFVTYCTRAVNQHNVAVGRYVIMPDHIHFFVRGDPNFALSPWVGGLKRAISMAVSRDPHSPCSGSRVGCEIGTHPQALPPQGTHSQAARLPLQGTQNSLWQPGFFDHVLRSDESYAQKWEYVRNNPVRAGLVASWQEWPYQGEITLIDRA
jgi:putative transposase